MPDTDGPLAVFRHCPRCASLRIDAPEPKRLVCTDCDLRFYVNPAAAVLGVLTNERGEILLIRRNREPQRGLLALPGGFVDPDEGLEEALAREVREEVGVEITDTRYLLSCPNRYRYRDVEYFTIDVAYVCRAASREAIANRDEVSEILFLAPDAVPLDRLAFESAKRAIAAYRRMTP